MEPLVIVVKLDVFEDLTPGLGLAAEDLMIGVGTKASFAPPSEPDWPISGIRLSSWWLTFKKIGMPQYALVLR